MLWEGHIDNKKICEMVQNASGSHKEFKENGKKGSSNVQAGKVRLYDGIKPHN